MLRHAARCPCCLKFTANRGCSRLRLSLSPRQMLFSAFGPIHLDPRMGCVSLRGLPELFFAPLDKADAFPDALRMTSLPVTQARSRLYQLLDEAADSHEPIQITGKRSNAVLVSEDDWRSIQETLYLLSIPGMRDSIRKGMAEPLGKSSTKPGW